MAYYNYKEVRDLIPNDFRDAYIEKFEQDGTEYDGDPNYDGHMWLLAGSYISYLQDGSPPLKKWIKEHVY